MKVPLVAVLSEPKIKLTIEDIEFGISCNYKIKDHNLLDALNYEKFNNNKLRKVEGTRRRRIRGIMNTLVSANALKKVDSNYWVLNDISKKNIEEKKNSLNVTDDLDKEINDIFK